MVETVTRVNHRRRLRLSCVECAKRRQRCDRETPCSRCIARGVSHRCRIEPDYVRPLPADAPRSNSLPNSQERIKFLKERVRYLERELEYKLGGRIESHLKPADLPHNPYPPCVSRDVNLERPTTSQRLSKHMNEAAFNLVTSSIQRQQSHRPLADLFGKATRDEVKAKPSTQLPRPKSYTMWDSSLGYDSTNTAVSNLIARLPSRRVTKVLTQAFFMKVNWRFGIIDTWFYDELDQLWEAVNARMRPSANFVMFLFALLALAPQDNYSIQPPSLLSNKEFFTHGLALAWSLEEDVLRLHSPSTGGEELFCMGVEFFAFFCINSGATKAAWKFFGWALRSAQGVGMHRELDHNYAHWGAERRLLRSRIWWNLVIWDRLFSCFLGHPSMISTNISDLFRPQAVAEGSQYSPFEAFQLAFLELSDIFHDLSETCINMGLNSDAVSTIDAKFQRWNDHLSSVLLKEWPSDINHHLATTEETSHILRCYTLRSWYITFRMNLHRAYISQELSPVSISSQPASLRASCQLCIQLAIEGFHIHCQTPSDGDPRAIFKRMFFILDGTVSLLTALRHAPTEKHLLDSNDLLQGIFEQVARSDHYDPKLNLAIIVSQVLLTLMRKDQSLLPIITEETGSENRQAGGISLGSKFSETVYCSEKSGLQPTFDQSVAGVTNLANLQSPQFLYYSARSMVETIPHASGIGSIFHPGVMTFGSPRPQHSSPLPSTSSIYLIETPTTSSPRPNSWQWPQ